MVRGGATDPASQNQEHGAPVASEKRVASMTDEVLKDYQYADVPKQRLPNGLEIPLLGLGTWKASPGEVGRAVENALRMGYRHIDCAEMYENQDEIGRTFHKIFKEDGKIKREDVWVTSKLANKHHDPEVVPEACKQTLRDLQLEQLDLYLMHWPIAVKKGPTVDPPSIKLASGPLYHIRWPTSAKKGPSVGSPIHVSWAAMEKLVDAGLTKSIGVSNFSIKKLKELLPHTRIKPAVHQIEGHAYFRNNYNIYHSKVLGMHVTAYSPLGTPDSASIAHRGKDVPLLLRDPLVQGIAQKHNKHPAQVLVRWGLQRGTSTIPKSTKVSHMRANLEAANWELPQDDFKALNFLGYQRRMVDGGVWFLNPEGPYKTLTDLWDYEEQTGWPPGETTVGIEVK